MTFFVYTQRLIMVQIYPVLNIYTLYAFIKNEKCLDIVHLQLIYVDHLNDSWCLCSDFFDCYFLNRDGHQGIGCPV